MKIAVFGNRYQDGAAEELRRLFVALNHAGEPVELLIESGYYAYLCKTLKECPVISGVIGGSGSFEADLVLSIGGDGTFLRTANRVGPKEIPIMGINSGHLGYLSAARISEAEDLVHDIVTANYAVEPRTMIEVSYADTSRDTVRHYALNEAAVLKTDTASMISVDAYINRELLASYLGDGLIVATPTGSTGYNLSVGGPIVEPSAPNWVISPIAAHSLTMRPLVVSDRTEMDVSTRSRSTSFLLSIDGRSYTLPIDTRLHLSRAPFVTNVVHRLNHNFIDTLRVKLLWGIDGR